MPDVMVAWLAGSRACDRSGALPDLPQANRADGAAGTFGVEGCRAAGAAPRGSGATVAHGQSWTELTGRCSPRGPGCSPRPLLMCRLVTPGTLLGWHGTGN